MFGGIYFYKNEKIVYLTKFIFNLDTIRNDTISVEYFYTFCICDCFISQIDMIGRAI